MGNTSGLDTGISPVTRMYGSCFVHAPTHARDMFCSYQDNHDMIFRDSHRFLQGATMFTTS